MTAHETVLLTGITGSIGSWVARTILEDGGRIVAIVRANTLFAAAMRVREALAVVGAQEHADRVHAVCGDICDSGLVEHLAGKEAAISHIVHCAGAVEFGQEFAALSHRVNVEGTANLLTLAEKRRTPFCHFSTAYIAGDRQGRVFEHEICAGQQFHNPYESSKCQAEMLVRGWAMRTGLDAFVLRPGIVVGDCRDGRIVHFDGLYNFLRLLDSVAAHLSGREFRVVANPHATKNLVPADYVARAAWHIIKTGAPRTYHITNLRPVSLATLRDIFADLFAVPGARLVREEDFHRKEPDRFESMYRKAAAPYAPYLAVEPVFDRTNTDAALRHTSLELPEMNMSFFQKLLRYARRTRWGKACTEVPAPVQGREKHVEQYVERYFDSFLTEKMHQQLLPNLKHLTATCRITVEDLPGRSWSLRIDQGRLEEISQNGMVCPCTFSLHSDTFWAIVSGRLAPQQAFFQRKIHIAGDMETGLKLATVLAAFFKKWPYSLETCHAG
jgi:nucleoside-diphosphate-sugar epimerase/predicted lipid carrier protein YhbT